MSETAEKEQELVAGTIGGITQKKADTWTVSVTPEGSQYSKNLWTKSTSLVEALAGKLGQHGAFVCNASYWNMADGKEVRSLWIESEADGTENMPETRPTPARVQVDEGAPVRIVNKPSTDAMSKEEWARKNSAIHKMACVKVAAAALAHTLPSDPSKEDLATFLTRTHTLYSAWHRAVLAERDDPTGEDVPF